MTSFQQVYEAFQGRVSAMVRGTHLPISHQEMVIQQVYIDINALIQQTKWPEKLSHQENLVTRIITCCTARHHKELTRCRRNRPVPVTDLKGYFLDREVWDKDQDGAWDTLEELLPTLPEKYREIVDLRLQNKSYAEVGQALGISESSAKVRHFRAVEKLREANSRRLKTA